MHTQVDVYTTWAKVTNCNGGGQCGTCIVDVRHSCPVFLPLSAFHHHAVECKHGGTSTCPCLQVVADPEGLLGTRNETESKKLRKVCCCQPPTNTCSVRRPLMSADVSCAEARQLQVGLSD